MLWLANEQNINISCLKVGNVKFRVTFVKQGIFDAHLTIPQISLMFTVQQAIFPMAKSKSLNKTCFTSERGRPFMNKSNEKYVVSKHMFFCKQHSYTFIHTEATFTFTFYMFSRKTLFWRFLLLQSELQCILLFSFICLVDLQPLPVLPLAFQDKILRG